MKIMIFHKFEQFTKANIIYKTNDDRNTFFTCTKVENDKLFRTYDSESKSGHFRWFPPW